MTVARVLGPKGLAGGLRLELLTDWPERLVVDSEIWVEGEADARRIDDVERGGRSTVIRLAGVATRDQAQALTGRFLEAPMQPLPTGDYYWHQLVGLRVVDPAGTELGTLAEVFRAGGAEVYRVECAGGELLVPALRSVVREIDLDAGRMVVDYPAEEVV